MTAKGSGQKEDDVTIDPTLPDPYGRIIAAAEKLRKKRKIINSARELERRMAQDRAIAALRAREELQAKAEAERKRQATLDQLAAEGKPIGAISRPLFKATSGEPFPGYVSRTTARA